MFENFDELLEDLILRGAVEIAGLDENGEPLFSFTEKIFEIAPEIARGIDEAFYSDIMALWQSGFLEMNITDVNPKVSLTELSFNNEAVDRLPKQLKLTLSVIKEALRL